MSLENEEATKKTSVEGLLLEILTKQKTKILNEFGEISKKDVKSIVDALREEMRRIIQEELMSALMKIKNQL